MHQRTGYGGWDCSGPSCGDVDCDKFTKKCDWWADLNRRRGNREEAGGILCIL